MLALFTFPCQVPNFTYCLCAKGEVKLSMSIKVVIKLLESKKLSFANPCQPGVKTSTKLAPKKCGVY